MLKRDVTRMKASSITKARQRDKTFTDTENKIQPLDACLLAMSFFLQNFHHK
jgi:hypothetical protein